MGSIRAYHNSPRTERSAVAIMLGLGALSVGAYGAASGVRAYNEWQEWRAQQVPEEEPEEKSEEPQQEKQEPPPKPDGPRENIFRQWFDVGTKYYEGGFEPEMTRREAALILGVRESSSPTRIKNAHRKLLILNHPDTGGSTYMAGKINEAKELLLKGKSMRGGA